jgi:cytochrome b involved in lipid metabolism
LRLADVTDAGLRISLRSVSTRSRTGWATNRLTPSTRHETTSSPPWSPLARATTTSTTNFLKTTVTPSSSTSGTPPSGSSSPATTYVSRPTSCDRHISDLREQLGLASELKTFPSNEIKKGIYNQKLKALQRERRVIQWPKNNDDLPILTWEQCASSLSPICFMPSDTDPSCVVQEEHKSSGRNLVVVGGYIHDVSDFINDHPGGAGIIKTRLGKDVTTAFHGGVYDHSSAPSSSDPFCDDDADVDLL